MRQARAGAPSTRTVQAPQTPCSHPTCTPLRPNPPRRKSLRSRRGGASPAHRSPFRRSSTRCRSPARRSRAGAGPLPAAASSGEGAGSPGAPVESGMFPGPEPGAGVTAGPFLPAAGRPSEPGTPPGFEAAARRGSRPEAGYRPRPVAAAEVEPERMDIRRPAGGRIMGRAGADSGGAGRDVRRFGEGAARPEAAADAARSTARRPRVRMRPRRYSAPPSPSSTISTSLPSSASASSRALPESRGHSRTTGAPATPPKPTAIRSPSRTTAQEAIAKSPWRSATSSKAHRAPGAAAGQRVATTISSSPHAVSRGPWKNARAGTSRSPRAERSRTAPSSSARTRGNSALGSACATEPPTVPRARVG